MKKFYRKATKNTPLVKGNFRKGYLIIEGKSYPEDSSALYEPLIEWCEEILDYKYPRLEIDIKINYMHSSTEKMLMELFEKLAPITEFKEIKVDWYYDMDDPDMKELADIYTKHFGKFVSVHPYDYESV